MACKIIEIGPGQNLFIGGNKKLMQWSVSQGEVTKDYGRIIAGDIESMVQTSDNKYLFVSDTKGC
jgi:WD40 repeat protein